MMDEFGTGGIEVHVPGQCPSLRRIFDQFCARAALEDMPRKAMTPSPAITIAGGRPEIGQEKLERDAQGLDMMASTRTSQERLYQGAFEIGVSSFCCPGRTQRAAGGAGRLK
jgi:hypothetical protein